MTDQSYQVPVGGGKCAADPTPATGPGEKIPASDLPLFSAVAPTSEGTLLLSRIDRSLLQLIAANLTGGACQLSLRSLAEQLALPADGVKRSRRRLLEVGLIAISRPSGLAPALRLPAWRLSRQDPMSPANRTAAVGRALDDAAADLSLLVQLHADLGEGDDATELAGALAAIREAIRNTRRGEG